MKICMLIILMMGTVLGQNNVKNEKELYRLTGSISKVETTYDKPEEIHIRLDIKYKLTNISEKNLILWKPSNKATATPLRVGNIFSKTNDFSESSIIESHFGGPSNSYADKWEKLRKMLDVKQPPEEIIITLQPNESWEFTSPVYIIGYKNARPGKIDFKSLEVSPIWLKTYHEVWSFNIEPKAENRSTKLVFGRMLQKRWIDYGHLLLDDIISEPIPIDLNSAFVKTDSQP